MNRSRPLAVLVLLLFMLPFGAASDAGAAGKRPITANDLWSVQRVGAPALSPDGRRAVVPVQEWSVAKNKPTSRLWLVDVRSGATRRLTNGDGSDSAPAWSHDGTRIAFAARRGTDTAASLYVIAADGGEAERILELPYGIGNPRWVPGDTAIVFGTQVDRDLAGSLDAAALTAMRAEAKRRTTSKMTAYATEVQQFRWFDRNIVDGLASRLVRIDLATRALTDLTPGYDRLFTPGGDAVFQVSPDGRRVALVVDSNPPPFVDAPNLDILLLPADGRGERQVLTSGHPRNDGAPRFSPDGRSLLFLRQVLPLPPFAGVPLTLWRHDFATGRSVPLSADIDLSIDDVAQSADGRTLWLQAEKDGRVPLFRMQADGTGFTEVLPGGSITGLDSASDTLVFLQESMDRPAELYTLDPGARTPRQLTRFNDALFANLDLGDVESHTFTGADGDEVQMWVTYPPGYDRGKRYPLVHLLHGGPHTMVRDSFGYRWNPHVFATPGWIVAQVNRHGSTGFGADFAMSIHGAWGEMPTEDLRLANEYLFAKVPAIDRSKVAAAGASYGGYLATWLLGHTDDYVALVNHAGVSDFIGQYGSDVTTGLFSSEVMGGLPWDGADGLQRNNPIAYAKEFRTPMLITHGEKDYRVPYGQSLALYGILQNMRVPSRLVLFPDENHWILSPQNSIHWNHEVQSWLARYVGGTPMAKPEFPAAE